MLISHRNIWSIRPYLHITSQYIVTSSGSIAIIYEPTKSYLCHIARYRLVTESLYYMHR